MEPNDLETKRALYGKMKEFARAEMARGLGRRHGRNVRLPWDEDEAPQAPDADSDGGLKLDSDALSELARSFVG